MEQLNPPIFDKLRTEVPSKRQIEFFLSDKTHVAYGGARGGGKSWAARRKLVLLAMRYDDLNILMLRRTLPELRENHIIPLMRDLEGYAKYIADRRTFVFPSGSRIVMGYCDNDADCSRYQGQEYDVICFEEATNFREEWIRFISSCLRTVRTDFRPRIYYTCNPGGVGHAYIKRLFIDRNYLDGECAEDYAFIPARVYDNSILMNSDPAYIKRLEALPASIRKAHLEGDWNVYSGQVFEEFRDDPLHYADREYTHVIDPFTPPESWRIYRSFDFGYAKPFAVTYWACDCDGRLFEILELYGCVPNEPDCGVKYAVDDIFKEIRRLEDEHPWLIGKQIFGVADPAIWQATTGISVSDVGEKYGIYFEKGENARIPSIQQIHYRLKFDENGIPMIYFFRNCRDMIRTLPILMYDPAKPEDVDTHSEDHLFDTMRYICAASPIKSELPPNHKAKLYDPLSTDDLPDKKRLLYL